jgi:hypothetical protein
MHISKKRIPALDAADRIVLSLNIVGDAKSKPVQQTTDLIFASSVLLFHVQSSKGSTRVTYESIKSV